MLETPLGTRLGANRPAPDSMISPPPQVVEMVNPNAPKRPSWAKDPGMDGGQGEGYIPTTLTETVE